MGANTGDGWRANYTREDMELMGGSLSRDVVWGFGAGGGGSDAGRAGKRPGRGGV